MILFHPTLTARRAAEIAQSQKAGLRNPARLEHDARGRPFIKGADPLAEAAGAPVEPLAQPGRLAWLIRVIRTLGRQAEPPIGRPVAGPPPTHPPPLGAGEEIR